jgi:hypothetical protein
VREGVSEWRGASDESRDGGREGRAPLKGDGGGWWKRRMVIRDLVRHGQFND